MGSVSCIASVIKIDWRQYDIGPATAEEMAGEFMGMDSSYFRNGRWVVCCFGIAQNKPFAETVMKPT